MRLTPTAHTSLCVYVAGVMRIADFAHIFTDDDFPIRWRRVYIRLLTTFEGTCTAVCLMTCTTVGVFPVAVELSDGELLIPSALPPEKPNLPCPAFPHSVVSELWCGCAVWSMKCVPHTEDASTIMSYLHHPVCSKWILASPHVEGLK